MKNFVLNMFKEGTKDSRPGSSEAMTSCDPFEAKTSCDPFEAMTSCDPFEAMTSCDPF